MVAIIWSDGAMISLDGLFVAFIRFVMILVMLLSIMFILAIDFAGRVPIGGVYAFYLGYVYRVIEQKWLD
jgi:hypothetical protein